MRHYLSTADFLKLQLNSGSVFERDEVVVTDNAEQPIYTYNTSTKTWEKLSVIPATSTAVSATTNPLTGGIVWTAAEFAAITPEAGKFYLVEA